MWRNFVLVGLATLAIGGQTALADFLIYTVPGTDLAIPLEGKVTVHSGGTVTCRHNRGALHFALRDCQIIRTQSKNRLMSLERNKAKSAGTAEAFLDLALWCVENGMLSDADEALADAWKIDPNHPKVKLMVTLVKYRRANVPMSPSVEAEMRDFVKLSDMKFTRSRHFVLLHDTSDVADPVYKTTVAQNRLALLEKVYDSFYMKFALEGYPLKIPHEPMRVVLLDRHADYLNFVKRLDPDLKNAAGFYLPSENIAIYYRQKTDESMQGLNALADALGGLRDEARRTPSAAAGQVIRFAKAIELLIDIIGEDQEIEVVTHEATHQLAANSGLLDREKFFVRWAHEGLASYFESPKDATWAGIGAVNEQRMGYYRILAADPVHSKIEFLVTDRIFSRGATHFSQLAAYGQAWALTHFLMDQHMDKLMLFYEKMAREDVDNLVRDKAWENATLETFKECFGDLEVLEINWRRYMRQLKTDAEILAEKM